MARTLRFPHESMVAMDRGYIDYGLFTDWTERGIDFVTRQKSSAAYEVIEERPVPLNRPIRADQVIQVTGFLSRKKCPIPLRRVVVWLEDKQEELVLWTNNLKLGATTIADVYKARRQIELFFKSLKQNFQVKTFVGTSANALKTQLWIALIAIVRVQIVRMRAVLRWSVSNLVAFLRLHLFSYTGLMALINDPMQTQRQPAAEDAPRLALENG